MSTSGAFTNREPTHVHYLLVTVAIAVWQGMIGVLVRWSSWPPVAMVWGRCVVTVLTLALFSRWRPSNASADRMFVAGQKRLATWGSGVLLAGHWVTLFWGYRVSPIGPVVVALFTFPIMAALVEPWFFAKRPRAVQLVTACVATLGVASMRWTDGDSMDGDTALGIVLGLASAAFYTARSIIARKLLHYSSASRIMLDQAFVVAVLLLPSLAFLQLSHVSVREIALVLVLGVAFTAIPHTLNIWSMRKLTVATSGVVGSLQTVSTLVCAGLFLGESAPASVWVGAAFVVGAVSLESWPGFLRAQSKPP